MCLGEGLRTQKSLEFTVICQDFITFMLSTSAQVLQSLDYAKFRYILNIRVPYT
jgi:hypothetical protein